MEVVLFTSIVTQLSVFVIDRYTSWRRSIEPATAQIQQNHLLTTNPNLDPFPNDSPRSNKHSTECSDQETDIKHEEGTVEALEHQLKQLRTQARRLNAPDTLVQYVRVMREANKVEKKLEHKRGMQTA